MSLTRKILFGTGLTGLAATFPLMALNKEGYFLPENEYAGSEAVRIHETYSKTHEFLNDLYIPDPQVPNDDAGQFFSIAGRLKPISEKLEEARQLRDFNLEKTASTLKSLERNSDYIAFQEREAEIQSLEWNNFTYIALAGLVFGGLALLTAPRKPNK